MRDSANPDWVNQFRSTPKNPLPAGAWDTHAHVFGPFAQYPLMPGCPYLPPIAPREAHLAGLETAGFGFGALVHASANGFDNSGVLDAVAAAPQRLHAVGVVAADSPATTLEAMHWAGMRALRFCETGPAYGGPKPIGVLGLESLKDFAPVMRELGWYADIWAKAAYVVEAMPWLSALGLPLVLDHMGNYDADEGVDGPAISALRNRVAEGNIWVKLCATRVTRGAWPDYADVRPFHDAFLEAAPDRMIWGSDWPYIMMDKATPDIGGQVDLFDAWTADDTLRRKVFVDNPRALFGTP
ncbi:amidohydrolase [Frigidibacter sp.]|uniref:amidohydrolase family protein n=1 Tax=Frigidibacter sp. TaxID=2586418 RepID=UPI002732318A|nr:amidohydrolase family protein [Frigidibacter sp.]MDP3339310.1 amidohydrolase family protein [Frigidibacter sp.]